jgi:hypothetical protein
MFLLGAGASADAGIPISARMIGEIEQLLKSDPEWRPFVELYHHVKSAIFYSSGLKGTSATVCSTTSKQWSIHCTS